MSKYHRIVPCLYCSHAIISYPCFFSHHCNGYKNTPTLPTCFFLHSILFYTFKTMARSKDSVFSYQHRHERHVARYAITLSFGMKLYMD